MLLLETISGDFETLICTFNFHNLERNKICNNLSIFFIILTFGGCPDGTFWQWQLFHRGDLLHSAKKNRNKKKTLVGVNVKDIKHKKRTFRIGSLSIRFHVEVVFHQGGSQ